MGAQLVALFGCALSLVGCYAPEIGACQVQCAAAGECPEGTSCSDGFCNPPGVSGSQCMANMNVDGGSADGGPEVDLDGMVEVLDTGPFQMGCVSTDIDCPTTGPEAFNESPLHSVTLSTYWIDRTEVTAAAYAACVEKQVCITPSSTYYNPAVNGQWPVTGLSRDMAVVYCRSVGKRLPTEAEWEKAARGDTANIYPWGDQIPGCKDRAHYEQAPSCVIDGPADVGSYAMGSSPYGVLDMSGNVWEWVSDSFGEYPATLEINPKGPTGTGLNGIVRGAGFLTEFTDSLRLSNRYERPPGVPQSTFGVRCAYP